MSEFWMFVATIVFGLGWLFVGGFVIAGIDYSLDHAGGWLVGMTPTEVDQAREMEKPQ